MNRRTTAHPDPRARHFVMPSNRPELWTCGAMECHWEIERTAAEAAVLAAFAAHLEPGAAPVTREATPAPVAVPLGQGVLL